jgi:ABC-type Mn2+/Zn2+ transport system permease subunit
LSGNIIVHAGHFAFGYLAKRYGLRYVSAYPGILISFALDLPTGATIVIVNYVFFTMGLVYKRAAGLT